MQINQKFEVEMVPIKSIKAYPNNPRKNEKAIDQVKKSLQEFGFQQPIVVDPKTKEIIVGHTRYCAAMDLGYENVPVKWGADLSEAKKKAYRIMDNRTSEFAQWDTELLLAEIDDIKLESPDYDENFLGFELKELSVKEEKWSFEKSFDESIITIRVPMAQQADVMKLIKDVKGAAIEVSNVKRFE